MSTLDQKHRDQIPRRANHDAAHIRDAIARFNQVEGVSRIKTTAHNSASNFMRTIGENCPTGSNCSQGAEVAVAASVPAAITPESMVLPVLDIVWK
jgi:hypothetical protein